MDTGSATLHLSWAGLQQPGFRPTEPFCCEPASALAARHCEGFKYYQSTSRARANVLQSLMVQGPQAGMQQLEDRLFQHCIV